MSAHLLRNAFRVNFQKFLKSEVDRHLRLCRQESVRFGPCRSIRRVGAVSGKLRRRRLRLERRWSMYSSASGSLPLCLVGVTAPYITCVSPVQAISAIVLVQFALKNNAEYNLRFGCASHLCNGTGAVSVKNNAEYNLGFGLCKRSLQLY